MSEFGRLLAVDRQLQFARRAVEKYQVELASAGGGVDAGNGGVDKKEVSVDLESAGSGSSQLNKRHILNVDDISKINYEVVKNIPGNLLVPLYAGGKNLEGQDLEDEQLENDVTQAKTKLYKNGLYAMNDEFVGNMRGNGAEGSAGAVAAVKRPRDDANEDASEDDLADIPLEDQVEWLQEIQDDLIHTYKSLVNKEKKWFTLKEVILDANAELDLFSTKDINVAPPNITLGDPNAPTNPYSTVNTILFQSKKKKKMKILP